MPERLLQGIAGGFLKAGVGILDVAIGICNDDGAAALLNRQRKLAQFQVLRFQPALVFLQLLLGLLALDNAPDDIGNVSDQVSVFLFIICGLVPNSQNRHDAPIAHDGYKQFPFNRCVTDWHPLTVRQGFIIIVDDRFSLVDTIYPHAGLVQAVVQFFAFRLTEFLDGACGPGLERECFLVSFNKVVKTDRAGGDLPDFIERFLHQLANRMINGKLEQSQAQPDDVLRSFALGDIADHRQNVGFAAQVNDFA